MKSVKVQIMSPQKERDVITFEEFMGSTWRGRSASNAQSLSVGNITNHEK
jgi:hypothetical protein